MSDDERFEALYRAAARYRAVSPQLRTLLAAVYERVAAQDLPAVKTALEALLAFVSSNGGRTDANCCTVDFFFSSPQWARDWAGLPETYRRLLDDIGGTLHESVYAPHIARNFESLPEQLLERVRRLQG